MRRVLGLTSLTFYGVGMILGAGIYTIIGKAAGLAGGNLWLPFVVAAVCAAFTALSYAELSSMIPKAGAEYSFLSHAFPKQRWLATGTGLMMAFAAAATASAVALAFSGYLSHFVDCPLKWTATLLILLFSALNIYGIRESTGVNIVFTIIELSGLILIIFLGMRSPEFGQNITAPVSAGFLPATALMIFAYLGFENLVNFTEEAKDPTKNIPRAVLLSLAISTILYLLVSFSALAILSPEQLAASNAPLMDAAMKTSTVSGNILGSIALFSTANTVLIALLAGSRILYGISRGGDLPYFVGKIHARRQTPYIACLILMLFAALFVGLGSVEFAASLASFFTLLSFAIVNLALITLRFTKPEVPRPFRVPLSIGKIPVLTVFGVLTIGILLFEFQLLVYEISLAFLLAIFSLHYFLGRTSSAHKDRSRQFIRRGSS